MSDQPGASPKAGTSAEAEDDKLDVFSESFDPQDAIYNPNFVFPDPNAPVSDNVEIFIRRLEQGPVQRNPPKSQPKKAATPSGAESPKRQFSQEQMPVQRAKKALPNVLTFMQKAKAKKGPMSVKTGYPVSIISYENQSILDGGF